MNNSKKPKPTKQKNKTEPSNKAIFNTLINKASRPLPPKKKTKK